MEIRPKLRADLVVSEHTETGSTKIIVLKDPVSEKFFRLTPHEYQFLKTFDGTRTLEQALENFRVAGHYLSPEDGGLLLGKAAQLGLLLGTRFGTAQFQRYLRDRQKEAKKARFFSSVYFLFIPLVNPDRFLEKTLGLFRVVANKWTGMFVASLAPGALYLLISGIPRIEREYTFFFNLDNLLYLWVTIALTKLIHELSHAYTAKSFGLHVPQMGVAFLIFFPCLFCNTTDAWQLADRRQRIAISAAGIIAEGTLAVLSIYIWYFSAPGIVNSLAFYIMAVSFVSTVLFNGNPLMKFDGYFMLIDYLRVPNLQSKSFGHMRYLFMNRVFGISLVPNPAANTRESSLFAIYGISAVLYRISLYTGIVIGVYYRFDKLLGIVLAVLAFSLFIVRPIIKGITTLHSKRSEIHPRPQGVIVFSLVALVILIPLLVPVSDKSLFPCYVASTDIQKITIPLHTSVAKVVIRRGSDVPKGSVLFELNPSMLALSLLKKQLERDTAQKQVELFLLDPKERGKAPGKQIEVYKIEDEIRHIEGDLKIAREGIVAPFDGIVTSLDPKLQTGFEPGDGVVVGELQSLDKCTVYALIPEKDRDKVSVGQEVSIWLPIRRGLTLERKIDSIKPYNEKDLHDSPFSSRLGGEVATEVKGDQYRDAPLEAQYRCSVKFSNSDHAIPLGITGRFVVPSPPQSVFSRFLDRLFSTFNRESAV